MNNIFKNKKDGFTHTLIHHVRVSVSSAKAKMPLSVGRQGFTLLFSLLILTIVLSASLGIHGIVIRQIKISQVSRESSVAFFTANAGIECALYWDIVEKKFDSPNYTIDCMGAPINGLFVASTTSFYLGLGNDACAKVEVNKNGGTVLTSSGYNIGDPDLTCASDSGRLQVERVLEASY